MSGAELRGLHYLSIDEIYVGQALKFHTEVITLESGRIVGVAWGKATAALARFCVAAAAGLGEDAGHLLDLSAAYWSSVAKHLPKAAVVFERVHLVKLGKRPAQPPLRA